MHELFYFCQTDKNLGVQVFRCQTGKEMSWLKVKPSRILHLKNNHIKTLYTRNSVYSVHCSLNTRDGVPVPTQEYKTVC